MAKYTDHNMIREIADEAYRELRRYCRPLTTKEKMKIALKRAAGRHVEERDFLFWPAGMLLLGLIEAERFDDACLYLRPILENKDLVIRHPDDALTGYACIRIYEHTGDVLYKEAADQIYEYLRTTKKDRKGSIIYNPSRGNAYIFADGAGMAAMFLSYYGKIFENREASDLAAKQLLNFRDYGMDERTGLAYHGYDVETKIKYGIIGWGRAMGWLLLGTTRMLLDFDQSEYPEVAEYHWNLLHSAMYHLREDGTFSWQLEAKEGPSDSSASGMIFYALAQTIHAGAAALQEEAFDENTIADAVDAIHDYVNGGKVYGASAECIDFAQYRQSYGNYPWGQGAVLAFLATN